MIAADALDTEAMAHRDSLVMGMAVMGMAVMDLAPVLDTAARSATTLELPDLRR